MQMTIQNPIYSLRVPESQKTKQWYKDYMEYIVPYDTTTIDQYSKLRMLYGIINNDITIIKKELDKLEKPLGPLFDMAALVDQELVVYNNLYPKYMYLVGQYLNRGSNFEVLLSSDSANQRKTKELQEEIQRSIEEKILLMQEQMQFNNPEEAQQHYEQMRSYLEPEDINVKTFKSELEAFYSDVIDYFKYKHDINYLKELTIKHAVISDIPVISIVEQHGQPVPIVENPIHFGYHKSPDVYGFQKGDYWWSKKAVSITEAYDELKNEISDDELMELLNHTGSSNTRPNKAWDVKSGKAYTQYDYTGVNSAKAQNDSSEKHIGQHQGQGNNRSFNSDDFIWRTYFQFKAYRETIFLTFYNENLRQVTEVVPNVYPIPKEATRVKYTNRYGMDSFRYEWVDGQGMPIYAEKLYIPRRYECIRYGTDKYINCREVPNQPVNIDNPFNFELSAKGTNLTSLNSEGISLIERALSSLMQRIVVKNLQNKEIAKYEGFIKNIDVSQIPEELAYDEEGNPLFEGADKLKVWRLLRRALGESYYDPNLGSQGLPNYQKSVPVKPEIAGSINEILLMQQMLDLIDRETGLQMLVPPQAEGIYQPYSNAEDNRMAEQQGFVQAEPIYSAVDRVIRSAINEYLKQFRQYYLRFFEENPDVDETFLNYVTPAGSQKLLKITPELLSHEDVGLFIHSGTANNQYRAFMQSYLQPLAQNPQGASLISEMVMGLVRGDSPGEIHKKIRIAELDQQRRSEEMQKAQQELERLAIERQDKIIEQQHQNKMTEIELEREYDLEEKAMDIYKFQQDINTDADGIPDHLEAFQLMRDELRKDRQEARKDKELKLKEKEVNIKSKQTKKSS